MSIENNAEYRVSPPEPATLRHADVEQVLKELQALRSSAMTMRTLGQSVEGRPIRLVSMGNGPRRVMLWSQMHGDESTHTAVLLDLISMLQRAPGEDCCRQLLEECTLLMIVMLNPDGAERWTRRNAQGIDINRDARALATPEGRILQAAFEHYQPEFGFNLHNQNPRSAVAGGEVPAALSVLVPPRDESNSQDEVTQRAKQVVSTLLARIADRCPGAISKYRADYMPRAFGEAAQRQGISTVLIEVGNWHQHSSSELTELHFSGLLAALQGIASGAYEQADTALYDDLPLSSSRRLYDVLLRGMTVVDGPTRPTLHADLAVNLDDGGMLAPPRASSPGSVVEVGDLREAEAIRVIDDNLWCVPGGIEFDRAISPTSLPEPGRQQSALLSGTTLLLGQVDLNAPDQLEALAELDASRGFAVNVGMIGFLPTSGNRWSLALRGVAHGVLAIVSAERDTELTAAIGATGVPLIASDDWSRLVAAGQFGTARQFSSRAQRIARAINVPQRGSVELGCVADFAMFAKPANLDEESPLEDRQPRHVLVGGRHAVGKGNVITASAGRLLRRFAE